MKTIIQGNSVDLVELKKQIILSFEKEHGRKPTRIELRKNIKRYKKGLKEKNKSMIKEDDLVKIFPVGADNVIVTLSSMAMSMMRRGRSFPINLISGDKTIRFVFMEEECYLKTVKKFTDENKEELEDREKLEKEVTNLSQVIADKSET